MVEHTLSRKPTLAPATVPKPKTPSSLVHHATASGGGALDAKTQREMGSRFGHDFSQVRIHTDTCAARSAQTLSANAYVVGSDIVFGEGRYAPGSFAGDRLLAHELTHVVQQSRYGAGDPSRASRKEDMSEREAETLAAQVVAGQAVQVQAAPQSAAARDEEQGGFFSSLASGAGSLLKEGWEGTKGAAGAVYNGYEKATDFKSLQSGNAKLADESKGQFGEGFIRGGINGEIDSLEKLAASGNQKMVDDSKGHWYESLAQGSAWVGNHVNQVAGGVAKGVGDLGFGIAGGLAHPIDALSGVEGIMEHNMTIPGLGSTLKAGHGLYDLAVNGGGQYGSSMGDLADHVFNPMTQMKDDAKFDTNLVSGIIAPDKNKDGTTDWSAWKDKPAEAAARAATNIVPFFLGMGEADAAKGADVASTAEAADASRVSSAPRTPTLPGIGPDLPPPTERGMPTIPGVQPGRTPTIPGIEPGPPLPEPVAPKPVDPLGKTDPALPAVDPLGKTDPAIPAVDPPASPVKTRNPVQQMDPVDPAKMYPGAPQPPGWRSGPVTPEGFPQEAPPSVSPSRAGTLPAPEPVAPPAAAKPISQLFPELYDPAGLPPESAPPPSVDGLLDGLGKGNPERIRTQPMFEPPAGSTEEIDLLLRGLGRA